MSHPPLDPMPEDVQTLLEDLRNREGASETAKAMVRARLDRTLALGWTPAAPAPISRAPGSRPPSILLSSGGRLLLAAAGVVGVGGLLWYAARNAPRAGSPAPVVAPSLSPAPPPAPMPAVTSPGAIPSAPAVSAQPVGESTTPAVRASAPIDRSRPLRRVAPEPNPSSRVAGSASAPSLAGERRLLDEARNALRDGDANRALAAVGEHARLYPEGQLTEEREVLAIQAMVRSGSTAAARARAEAFLARFPDSPLHRVVQATVDSLP